MDRETMQFFRVKRLLLRSCHSREPRARGPLVCPLWSRLGRLWRRGRCRSRWRGRGDAADWLRRYLAGEREDRAGHRGDGDRPGYGQAGRGIAVEVEGDSQPDGSITATELEVADQHGT